MTDTDTGALLATWRRAVAEPEGRTRDELLEALRANAVLVDDLTGQRWLVMRAARTAGASWEQLGSALGMSRQSAWEFLKRRLADGAR